jgi:cytochrome c oxidase subunit 2
MMLLQKRLRLFGLLGVVMLVLAGCSGESYLSTLQPQGDNAQILYDLMILSTIIMAVVVAVVTVIFVYATLKFRRTKENENVIPKQVEGNHKLEVIWTVIPIILLLILTIPTVKATFDLDIPSAGDIPEDAVEVNVTGKQYWWEFEYPDEEFVTSQDLIIPTGEKVYLSIKAGDVKHAFWVPAIAGKIDANVEGENFMWLNAEEPGIYYGKCAELCGASHALMDFKVKAVPKEEYNEWVASMKKPTEPAETELAVQGEEIFNQSCISCHATGAADERPSNARLAPNLANFADRTRIAGILEHNEENLRAWLSNPEAVKPGNKMTGTYDQLNDNELDALTEYLMGLSKE